MWLILFFLVCFLVFVLYGNYHKNLGPLTNLRLSFIQTLISIALVSLCFTEILSVVNLINKKFFIIFYVILTITLLAFIIIKIKNKNFCFINPVKAFSFISIDQKAFLAIILIIIILPLLFLAIYVPPNNIDAMLYHLTRVEHWIHNQNIDHYPTQHLPQLYIQPLSEYIILQLKILSNSDWAVNLVQFFSFLGSILTATLIVKKMGSGLGGQLLTAIFVLSVPMGILQATSTQTDYNTTFIFLSFLYFGLISSAPIGNRIFKKEYLFFAALSFGLGLATKGTFYFFALPFVIWFGIRYFKQGYTRAIKIAIIFLVIIISINGPGFARNYSLTGSIFGDKELQRIGFNKKIKFNYTLYNLIRNLGMQLAVPCNSCNGAMDKVVLTIGNRLGIKANNYDITYEEPAFKTYYHTRFTVHEDFSGNIFIILFGLTSILLLFLYRKKIDSKEKARIIFFGLCVFAGITLFSGIVRWQPFGSRLMLPFFASLGIFCGIIFDKTILRSRRKLIFEIVIIVLFAQSLIYVYFNENKNYITKFANINYDQTIFSTTRAEKYFMHQTNFYQEYVQIIKILEKNNIRRIGLLADKYYVSEYPFWALMDANSRGVSFEYVKYPSYLKKSKNFDPGIKYGAIIAAPGNFNDVLAEYTIKKAYNFDFYRLWLL